MTIQAGETPDGFTPFGTSFNIYGSSKPSDWFPSAGERPAQPQSRVRYVKVSVSAGTRITEIRAYGSTEFAGFTKPVMEGATINLANPNYSAGSLAFHASTGGMETPDGYIAVEYGTVIIRNALLNGEALTKATPDAAIAFKRNEGGLAIPADSYTFLRTADVDENNTVAAGYAGTRYAARAYIVYKDVSTGEEQTIYSDEALVSSVNRIRRALACRLMNGGIAFGSYDKEAVLAGTQAHINEVWAFVLENKELLI